MKTWFTNICVANRVLANSIYCQNKQVKTIHLSVIQAHVMRITLVHLAGSVWLNQEEKSFYFLRWRCLILFKLGSSLYNGVMWPDNVARRSHHCRMFFFFFSNAVLSVFLSGKPKCESWKSLNGKTEFSARLFWATPPEGTRDRFESTIQNSSQVPLCTSNGDSSFWVPSVNWLGVRVSRL